MTKVGTRLAGQTRFDHFMYHLGRNLVVGFCRVWCRETVEGSHHIPPTGAFVLAPVHRSILDTPISAAVTRRRLRYMGADKYWKNRWFGRLLTAFGGFPVSRGTADKEALSRCIDILRAGEPLVLFPEGERKSGPLVQPLFDGATYVALKAGVPIVPVGIGGSERAMPKGSRFIYPRKVHVVVGAPIPVPAAGDARITRAARHELSAALQAELQHLFDRAEARVSR
jgi:1-acyl-sn-glycerol-3-phosphate acyltransferase